MSSARFSRRGLFGVGLSRLVEERMSALDRAAPPPSRRRTADEEAARRRDEATREWGEGDGRAWFSCLEPAAAHLLEACDVRPGERLLDVAAGDGNAALAAARAGAVVSAVDLSPVLVERGRSRCAEANADIEWAVGDAEILPYPDSTFDRVVSNFGVIHAHDPRAAAAELARVVRPGGTVAMTAWARAA